MNIYVVTAPENGCDCVCGVYQAKSELAVMEQYCIENGYDKEYNITDFEQWFDDNNYIVHDSSLTIVE